MVIEYYKPETVSVNVLLGQAITSGAYDTDAGWIHKDLVTLSKKYGLDGKTYDVSALGKDEAFVAFKKHLDTGPVIVSVHYKFNPQSKIPHLVVIDGMDDNLIYYNDPAQKTGEKTISKAQFLKGWKERFIVLRPATTVSNLV